MDKAAVNHGIMRRDDAHTVHPVTTSVLTSAEKSELLWSYVFDIRSPDSAHSLIDAYKKSGMVKDVLSLHNLHQLQHLQHLLFTTPTSGSPVQWCRYLLSFPTHAVAEYYGCSVATYFAWLEHYTQWLLYPAVIGILMTIYDLYNYDDISKATGIDGGDDDVTVQG